ncbi:hypothetical protein U0070_007898 [Myodes glareolus]|uniref:Large ribosomal subunit protein eL36 n=1 Tax=Myodes glareolus TaxID=447135 RepID=A0AAW0IQV9_MYOGA
MEDEHKSVPKDRSTSFLSWLPLERSSHGPVLPHGRGPEGDEEREPTKAQLGRLTKHTKFMQDMILEVCGFAPYEQRAMELLMVSKDKRAQVHQKQVGTHIRTKRKELSNVLAAMRKAVATKD